MPPQHALPESRHTHTHTNKHTAGRAQRQCALSRAQASHNSKTFCSWVARRSNSRDARLASEEGELGASLTHAQDRFGWREGDHPRATASGPRPPEAPSRRHREREGERAGRLAIIRRRGFGHSPSFCAWRLRAPLHRPRAVTGARSPAEKHVVALRRGMIDPCRQITARSAKFAGGQDSEDEPSLRACRNSKRKSCRVR